MSGEALLVERQPGRRAALAGLEGGDVVGIVGKNAADFVEAKQQGAAAIAVKAAWIARSSMNTSAFSPRALMSCSTATTCFSRADCAIHSDADAGS